MTKRTFVLLLSLFPLITGFGFSLPEIANDTLVAQLFFNRECGNDNGQIDSEEVAFDFAYDDNQATICADISEWRENINYLLRIRNHSFRFLGIENTEFSTYKYHYQFLSVQLSKSIFLIEINGFLRPEYYQFLHRLCPF
mgnify:CR=1 FL=1